MPADAEKVSLAGLTLHKSANTLLTGTMPDFEFYVTPRCIFFASDEGYKRPQYTYFSIQNRDKVTAAFRFRTKDRNFLLFSPGHGFLAPGASAQIAILVTDHERWVRDPANYVGRIHKVVVENLIVNANLKIPEQETERKALSRQVFAATRHSTGNRNDLSIYTKIRVVLPFYEFSAIHS